MTEWRYCIERHGTTLRFPTRHEAIGFVVAVERTDPRNVEHEITPRQYDL